MTDIVDDLWDKYNYTGYGSNTYTWTYSTYTTEVTNNRPALINITFGYYADHSVTLVGYRTYTKSLSTDKGFLKVYDGWTTANRYIDYASYNISTTASITKIFP